MDPVSLERWLYNCHARVLRSYATFCPRWRANLERSCVAVTVVSVFIFVALHRTYVGQAVCGDLLNEAYQNAGAGPPSVLIVEVFDPFNERLMETVKSRDRRGPSLMNSLAHGLGVKPPPLQEDVSIWDAILDRFDFPFNPRSLPGTFFTVSKKRLVYATERGFLSLSNTTLIKHNVPRAMVRIPSDHNCLGSSLPRLILRFVVGYDTALLNGLFYTFHGKGYVLDPAEDVVYNFNAYDTQSWALMDFVSPADLLERLLAKIALFVFVFVVLVLYRSLVSYLCRKVFLPLFLQLVQTSFRFRLSALSLLGFALSQFCR